DRVLRHLSLLGLQVNWEKSKLSPVQSISFLGMELDSVNMMARLTEDCLNLFSEAPGAYGSRSYATRPASYETASALAPWPDPEMGMDLLSQGMGTIWHPHPDLWNLHVWTSLVIDTITQARAPSMMQAYALRLGLYNDWCSSRREDPQRCSIGVVLSFLQEKLERRLSPSTLKVYVAAITAYHDAVDGLPLGRHHLIIRFLIGAKRLNPRRPHLIPSWDLSTVLTGLWRDPFGPLESVELKYLSLKTSLLIALTSIKRVGNLHAFLVNKSCLEFGPADSHVIMRPWPGYVPKVPTTPFRDQVVNLQALPPEEADMAFGLLCPLLCLGCCVLCIYVDRTRSFRRSEQLFVCFGGQQKRNAVSKQRLAHWVVDAITLAYQCQ
ncbi:hypothetical protein M9458_033204, partial [Cirrhinus mrigala]